MPSTFNTPGVYIQEISTIPASIVPVATAIPAFVGVTEKHDRNPGDEALELVPYRITSMVEYEAHFGGPKIALSVATATGAVTVLTDTDKNKMYYAVLSYFTNGGGPCYICSTATYNSTAGANIKYAESSGVYGLKDGLDKVAEEDEPTLLVIPDAVSLGVSDFKTLMDDMLDQCNTLQDRFAIMDSRKDDLHDPTPTDALEDIRDQVGTQALKYGGMYMPHLVLTGGYPNTAIEFDGGALNDLTLAEALVEAEDDAAKAGALYPLLETIRKNVAAEEVTIGPSGPIAGVYATVDRERGVWKAPANVSLRGVQRPSFPITNDQQGLLNVDATTGKSVNAIRFFSGKGILVWGARTLAGNDNEWRYVPVRRLYIFVEESIKKATEFVVFEPNDANTWNRVRTMVENFLTGLWRDGALAGAKPEEAFFVNVGLGETMTADDILNGRLIVEIGMAAVRPAEFIILRFSHKIQES